MLNGRKSAAELRAGQPIKLVVLADR
jgi:hypothetical protein